MQILILCSLSEIIYNQFMISLALQGAWVLAIYNSEKKRYLGLHLKHLIFSVIIPAVLPASCIWILSSSIGDAITI